MANAKRLRAIANADAGLDTLTRSAPAAKALGPGLGAAPKAVTSGAADKGVTIAQVRQMAFSPDPNDRALLRELVAGMPPKQQNNLYLQLHREMRSARAGVDDAGKPVAELSPEGQLIESIIWDGVEPPPERLAAIKAVSEAGDVGGLNDVPAAEEALDPKGPPRKPKAELPEGVKEKKVDERPRFRSELDVTAGKDGSVEISRGQSSLTRQDAAAIRKGERYEKAVAAGKTAEKPLPVGRADANRSAADLGETAPLDNYTRTLARIGGLVDPRAVKGDSAFRNMDMDGIPDVAQNIAPGGGSALPAARGPTGGANAAARTSAGDVGDLEYLMRERGVFNPNLFKSPEELARYLTAGAPQEMFTALPVTQADRARALDAIGDQMDVINTDDLPEGIRLTPDQQRGVAYDAVREAAPDVVAKGTLDGRSTVQQQFIEGLARKLDELYGSYGWGDAYRGPQVGASDMPVAPAGGLGDPNPLPVPRLGGELAETAPTADLGRPLDNVSRPQLPETVDNPKDIYRTEIDPETNEVVEVLDQEKVARQKARGEAGERVKGAGPAGDLTGTNEQIAAGRASKRQPVIDMLTEQHGRDFTSRRTVDIRRELEQLPPGDPARRDLELELRDALLIDDYLSPPDRMAKSKGGKGSGKGRKPKAEQPPPEKAMDLDGQPADPDAPIDAEFEMVTPRVRDEAVVNDIGTNYTVTGRRPADPVEPAATTDMIPVGPAYDPNAHVNWRPGDPNAPRQAPARLTGPDVPSGPGRIRQILNSTGDYVRRHPVRSAIAGIGGLVGLSAFLNSGANRPDGYNESGGGSGGGGMSPEEAARLEQFQDAFGPMIPSGMGSEGRIRAAIRAGQGAGGGHGGLNPNTQILQNWVQ